MRAFRVKYFAIARNLTRMVSEATRTSFAEHHVCQLDTAIDIYDDKIATLSFSKDKPVGVIIEEENIVTTLRTLFEYVSDTASGDTT